MVKMENIVNYIREKYGMSKLRKFHRFHKMNFPEIFWESPSTDGKVFTTAGKIYSQILENDLHIVSVITSDNKRTSQLVAEIVKKFSESNWVRFITFDELVSRYYDRWKSAFEPKFIDEIKYVKALAITGVSYKVSSDNRSDMLNSFARMLSLIIMSGIDTKIILGMDLIKKDDIEKNYGEEFRERLEEIYMVKLDG